jgi:hypothetical protein
MMAAISTQNNPVEGRVSDRIDGGVALYHAGTGLSLTLAGADQEYKRSFYENFGRSDGDNRGYTMRLGWRRDWFSLGETRMAFDFGEAEDVLYKNDETRSTSFFISQNIEAWSPTSATATTTTIPDPTPWGSAWKISRSGALEPVWHWI